MDHMDRHRRVCSFKTLPRTDGASILLVQGMSDPSEVFPGVVAGMSSFLVVL